MTASMSGMMTTSAVESGTSIRTAMMTPPIAVIGAMIIMFRPMATSCCICCTSLVFRVMSDGVPKKLTSVCENASTRRKMALRTSRPNAMAVLEPQYTETIEIAPTTSETSSMIAPYLRMVAISPLATPSLMILALRSGRNRLPMACSRTSTSTSMSCFQYGFRYVVNRLII